MRFLIGCLLTLPLILRAWYAEAFVYQYTNTRFLGFIQVLYHDAAYYSALLLLLLLSLISPQQRLLNALLRLGVLLMLGIYLLDYLVIVHFNTHLVFGDIIKYADYSLNYLQQIYKISLLEEVIIGVLVSLLLLVVLGWRFPATRLPLLPMLVIASGCSLVGISQQQNNYAHAWVFKNVIDYNLTILSESAPYSPSFIDQQRYAEAQHCQTAAPQPKNIIILMVESLSNYQSRFFSGLNDWTPELDKIARQNLAYSRFYANGFITEDGEIALLTGLLPLYPPSSYSDYGGTSFHSFFNLSDSLPLRLHKLGYHSDFLTTADLEFGQTGAWAKSIGFDYVEGHEHPDYNAWERFHFRSAPDEALYQRVMKRIQQHDQQRYLIFIKTVSSHHPYENPENHEHSEQQVFEYTDRQIGHFYRQLQAHGFFKDGVLVIVGDHHSMTPLRADEISLFGQAQASAHVPLIVAGSEHAPRRIDQQHQQIDVFNTLAASISGEYCSSDWRGVLWGNAAQAPRFIAHRRGDNRDQVSVFSQDLAYLIKLDGDATRLLSPEQAPAAIVDKINAVRIERLRSVTANPTPQ